MIFIVQTLAPFVMRWSSRISRLTMRRPERPVREHAGSRAAETPLDH